MWGMMCILFLQEISRSLKSEIITMEMSPVLEIFSDFV
jgi:hypothetical protein